MTRVRTSDTTLGTLPNATKPSVGMVQAQAVVLVLQVVQVLQVLQVLQAQAVGDRLIASVIGGVESALWEGCYPALTLAHGVRVIVYV